MSLVLASGSPRRAKILRAAGVSFTVVKTEAPEVSFARDPARTVRVNAAAKWHAGATAARSGDDVLAADTIVWFADRIYGKPKTLEEAAEFLRTLQGQTHTVFTGTAFGRVGDAEPDVRVDEAHVTFRALSEEAIAAYVDEVKPLDRAGAYDIDESGDRIVAGFTGEYENIMGLPLAPLRAWGLVRI